MKSLQWFCTLVVIGAIVAASWPDSSPNSNRGEGAAFAAGWRKTADGWERLMPPIVEAPSAAWCDRLAQVHPLVIAALQVLLSSAALVTAASATPLVAKQPSIPAPHRQRDHSKPRAQPAAT